jgi:alanyl-tRNA synthetase
VIASSVEAMTIALFLSNPYSFETSAEIIDTGSDENGQYLILSETIFYPQGGGQPSDVGTIECGNFSFGVLSVRKDGDAIKHYVGERRVDGLKGSDCLYILDGSARILHMRYHSAGHLLSNVAEVIYPEIVPIKAHCFPKEAYVEFRGEAACDRDEVTVAVEDAVEANLPITVFAVNGEEFEQKFYKLPYPMPPKEILRVVQIGQHKPIPCGGTHVASTAEIGNFEIAKIKNKNGNLRISFAII